MWIAYRKSVLTDETGFKQFYEMDFCIISVLNLEIPARLFWLTPTMKGERRQGLDTALDRNNGNKCFSFMAGFSDFVDFSYAPLLILPPAWVSILSGFGSWATALQQHNHQHQQTDGSIHVNHLFVFLLLSFVSSFLPGSLLFLSLSLTFFDSLSLSPSIPSPVISARQALISAPFVIVGASDCSSLWKLQIYVAWYMDVLPALCIL